MSDQPVSSESTTLDGQPISKEDLRKKMEESNQTKKFVIREDEKNPGNYKTKPLLLG